MSLDGFPKRYEKAGEPTGDAWLSHYDKAKHIVEGGGILLMYGGHGTGKTRMSYELAKNTTPPDSTYVRNRSSIAIERPRIYTTAVNLFMMLRDTYRRDTQSSEREIIDQVSTCALLVIDEIQERGETEFEDRKLNQIIDTRYMDERPTILISNHTRKDFAKTLSPAVIDRIRENGLGLHFDWTSYRARK